MHRSIKTVKIITEEEYRSVKLDPYTAKYALLRVALAKFQIHVRQSNK